MDYTIHGVSKSQTGLSDFHFHWLVLMRWGGRQPVFNTGRRESLAPPSVRDGNCTLCLTGAVAVCLGPVPVAQTVRYLRVIQKTHVPWVRKIPWRRKLQPTPVFLPEESLGQRSLVGYSPWGHKESNTTEQLNVQTQTQGTQCICTHIFIQTDLCSVKEHLCHLI